MGSLTDAGDLTISPPPCFHDFQSQTSLMTSCTLLWKELSDHVASLEQDLLHRSDSLGIRIQTLDMNTKESLAVLEKRENTIDASIQTALALVQQTEELALVDLSNNGEGDGEVDDSDGMLMMLKRFCLRMDYRGFWRFVSSRRKESDVLRVQIPSALVNCVDPARFVLDSISEVFPVDVRAARNDNDLGWACVLVLQSLIPLMVGSVLVVTPVMKERAKRIAETWKCRFLDRQGMTSSPLDAHTFLQHLVTFEISVEEDFDLYRRFVIAAAWRKQMPKLAIALGLSDIMPDMIEELISRRQEVDAVHFIYEAGLATKFPPVPLLKNVLRDAKMPATLIFEDPKNSCRFTGKKEQSSVRAVIKCIEEYQLEKEFPLHDLKKHLENLEKTGRAEKKKYSAPANKRIRASNGGPMPPAKAGRSSSNAHVSSFPNPPFSPYGYATASNSPPYPYSPETIHLPQYVYSPELYLGSPMGHPAAYGGYANAMPAAYQHPYYC